MLPETHPCTLSSCPNQAPRCTELKTISQLPLSWQQQQTWFLRFSFAFRGTARSSEARGMAENCPARCREGCAPDAPGSCCFLPSSPPRLLPLRVLVRKPSCVWGDCLIYENADLQSSFLPQVLQSPRGRVGWALAAPIRRPDHTGSTRHGAREGARRGRVHALSDTSRRYLQVGI